MEGYLVKIKKMVAVLAIAAATSMSLGVGVASAGNLGKKAGYGICWDNSKSVTYNTIRCFR